MHCGGEGDGNKKVDVGGLAIVHVGGVQDVGGLAIVPPVSLRQLKLTFIIIFYFFNTNQTPVRNSITCECISNLSFTRAMSDC